jgi:hypothetical protein
MCRSVHSNELLTCINFNRILSVIVALHCVPVFSDEGVTGAEAYTGTKEE